MLSEIHFISSPNIGCGSSNLIKYKPPTYNKVLPNRKNLLQMKWILMRYNPVTRHLRKTSHVNSCKGNALALMTAATGQIRLVAAARRRRNRLHLGRSGMQIRWHVFIRDQNQSLIHQSQLK